MKTPTAHLENGAWVMKPIGVARSPFREKFGIPRQANLVKAARTVIKLNDDPDLASALEGLDGFSHLWVLWMFHAHDAKHWKPSIRPPRLGGRERVGVLASRSPHRPNPIAISVLEIESIDRKAEKGAEITLFGGDLLDGTPVLDVKPYLPYTDSVPGARAGWAEEEIPRYPVEFTERAREDLSRHKGVPSDLERLVVEMLAIDPRPSFQKRKWPIGGREAEGKEFGILIAGFDVHWKVREGRISVLDLTEGSDVGKDA